MFIESKHFARLPSDIQKNVIAWSEKLDGMQDGLQNIDTDIK
jgi:hypothetical protein